MSIDNESLKRLTVEKMKGVVNPLALLEEFLIFAFIVLRFQRVAFWIVVVRWKVRDSQIVQTRN